MFNRISPDTTLPVRSGDLGAEQNDRNAPSGNWGSACPETGGATPPQLHQLTATKEDRNMQNEQETVREKRNRLKRERYRADSVWREAQKEKARNRYHERYRDDPEFRERKKAEYHERRKADPEWRAAEQDRKRVAYRERYRNDPEWREAEKARSRAYKKRMKE